ncbi:hypothetical protein DV737_g4283, partial [Chaetothyriales sp. CBS 132003]
MSQYAPPPKVLLFDIGGVCVLSPFQAIIDYEQKHSVPRGYINYSIRALAPNGAWHRLERGEIPNDDAFMRAFKADFERPDLWAGFHRQQQQKQQQQQQQQQAISSSPIRKDLPPVPSIDAHSLYWAMMSTARTNDPVMYPALQKLKADGRFHLAALSNTTVFPDGHPFNERTGDDDIRNIFDVFVSSAHVGMRKPERPIYEYTLAEIRKRWGDDIQPADIVFSDDIGENLKTAKQVGFRTIRVFLGRTADAVRELERYTGLSLLDQGDDNSKARL